MPIITWYKQEISDGISPTHTKKKLVVGDSVSGVPIQSLHRRTSHFVSSLPQILQSPHTAAPPSPKSLALLISNSSREYCRETRNILS